MKYNIMKIWMEIETSERERLNFCRIEFFSHFLHNQCENYKYIDERI